MNCILFIDDDVFALQLMSKVSSLLGYKAILSTSAKRGLTMAADERPSLIVVDMQMDEMSGQDFVRQVRRSPDIANLPVVILTAGSGYGDEENARQAGANGLLFKPIGLEEFSTAVQTFAIQAQSG